MPSSKYPPQCQHILVKRWTYHLFHQLNHSFFHFFHSMKWPSFWSLNHKLKIIQNPSSLVDTSSQVSFKSVPYPLCLVNPIHLQSYTQLLVFLGEPLWTAHFSLSSRDRTQWSHGVKIMNFRTLQAERKIQLLLILAQFLTYGRPSVNICSGVDWNALSPASPPLLWFCPLPPGLQQAWLPPFFQGCPAPNTLTVPALHREAQKATETAREAWRKGWAVYRRITHCDRKQITKLRRWIFWLCVDLIC